MPEVGYASVSAPSVNPSGPGLADLTVDQLVGMVAMDLIRRGIDLTPPNPAPFPGDVGVDDAGSPYWEQGTTGYFIAEDPGGYYVQDEPIGALYSGGVYIEVKP